MTPGPLNALDRLGVLDLLATAGPGPSDPLAEIAPIVVTWKQVTDRTV